MPGPFTVVTFRDADGDEFPITLIGQRASMEDAIAEANGILTQAIWEGKLNPTKPITVDLGHLPYEWGGVMSEAERQRVLDNAKEVGA